MIFRAIALSLAILIGIGAILPLATVHADGVAKKHRHAKKKHKKYKKYSKKWWRAYRQRMARKNL